MVKEKVGTIKSGCLDEIYEWSGGEIERLNNDQKEMEKSFEEVIKKEKKKFEDRERALEKKRKMEIERIEKQVESLRKELIKGGEKREEIQQQTQIMRAESEKMKGMIEQRRNQQQRGGWSFSLVFPPFSLSFQI